VIKEEIKYVEDNLERTGVMEIDGISVNPIMTMTMVDGKVCNAAMDNSSTMRCYVCNATSKDFNSIDEIVKRPVAEESLKFGLSPLHCRIRTMESLVHLADKLPIAKHTRSKLSADEKYLFDANKARIRKQLREELGLLIDVVKSGFGNTNDGNTARRFFDNIEKVASVTNLDIELLKKFKIVLQVISCGKKVNISKFENHCLQTAKYYVKKYPWSNLTPTLHKLLIHSPVIIQRALLPIGVLSEEAAEATNKVIRKFREEHSRRMDRTRCNLDVIKRLLLMSDPYFSGLAKRKVKKHEPLLPETMELLEKEINEISEDDNNSD